MRARLVAVVLAVAVALAAPRSPRADPPTKDACVASFEDAQRLRLASKLIDAREKLRVCSQDACPDLVKGNCTTWLHETEEALPTIVVVVRDAQGADLADAIVRIDGERVADRIDGREIALDPGEHEIAVERGGTSHAQKMLIVQGEKSRLVRFVLEADQGPMPHGAADELNAPPAPAVTGSHGVPTATWLLGGVSLVALGGFAYFGLKGNADLSHLKETCAPGCDPSDLDAVKTKHRIADVFLVVSIASAVGATIVLFAAPNDEPRATASITIVPGAAMGTFSARF